MMFIDRIGWKNSISFLFPPFTIFELKRRNEPTSHADQLQTEYDKMFGAIYNILLVEYNRDGAGYETIICLFFTHTSTS